MKKGTAGWISGLLSFLLIAAMALTGFPGSVTGLVLESQAATTLNNPRIASDNSMSAEQKVTWDCVWLGSYPQTEIVDKPETSGVYGMGWRDESDYKVDNSLYNTLKTATGWTSSGDITISGIKYKRIKFTDATYRYDVGAYDGDNEIQQYIWKDNSSYHYFRYEKIKWRVLKVSGSSAFLLADKALDAQKYNNNRTGVTWASSTIRSWLNNTFLGTAFSSAEQGAIQTSTVKNDNNIDNGTAGGANTSDKVFLLSEAEVCTDAAKAYGFISDRFQTDEARMCVSAAYAKAMGASVAPTGYTGQGCSDWWLRSPGDDTDSALYAEAFGCAYSMGALVSEDRYGIRPALNLNITSSNLWSYAGTVCSDGTKSELAYTEPGKTSISSAQVTSLNSAYNYTGSAISPKLTVTLSGKTLTLNTDYTVAYKNNINAGTATVEISGKGNYEGTVTKTFKINKNESEDPTNPVTPTTPCDHSWDAGKVTKELTPYADGERTYTCTKCSQTKTEKIQADAQAVTVWINQLPEPENITEKDIALINAVRAAYDKLDSGQKKLVSNDSLNHLTKATEKAASFDPSYTPCAIDEANFQDKNFRDYVSSKFDTNKDGILSTDEAGKVQEIDVTGKGISSMKGVEKFKNLQRLWCCDNKLTTLNVSKNRKLIMLNCKHNNIGELNISNNLELIRCHKVGEIYVYSDYYWFNCFDTAGALIYDRGVKVTPAFTRRNNPMAASGKTVVMKSSKLKKKARTISLSKCLKVSRAKGKVTYAKVGGSKKIAFNAKKKTIKLKKKLKKGKYTIKVKVTAAGNAYYKAKSKVVTVVIRVK